MARKYIVTHGVKFATEEGLTFKFDYTHVINRFVKFKIWKVTFFFFFFFFKFLPQRNYGKDFRFSENNGNIECALIRDELYLFSIKH